MFKNLERIPNPSARRIAMRIKPSAAKRIRNGHPWLFDKAIKNQSFEGLPGDLGVIFDDDNKFLAIGLYDPFSPIRLRILHNNTPTPIDEDFFHSSLLVAYQIRKNLPQNTNGYRLIHGENDQLPGLVIDKYGDTIVLKIYTLAWIPYLRWILPSLQQVVPYKTIILRFSRKIQADTPFCYGLKDGDILYGDPNKQRYHFVENGLVFEVNPIVGHKTGFYLDQRENRERVAKLSKKRSVLNLFSYTGGFSVYAAKGGATEVVSVDINQHALETAKQNFLLYQKSNPSSNCQHSTITANVFDILPQMAHQHRKFDMVIIDPPSFAKSNKEVPSAINAYQRLTRQALQVIKSGGIIVQSSCSSHVKPGLFYNAVHQAARRINRSLKEIERTSHPLDHPIAFKEGEYLKCLFAEV